MNGSNLLYDANGNLTNDNGTLYSYDDENRLRGTSGLNIAASTLKYDPLGRLYEITINGTKTTFLYDGDALVAEYNASNVMTNRYVHGDQVDEPWVQYEGAAVGISYWRYLHADHQGSIIARSTSTGALHGNALSYDSYGIPKSTNQGRFGYTGQAWLKELGLYHYKARVYHPKLGRFLQTDPIFYKDNMNMYGYVGNDPLNKIDPTGMRCRGTGTESRCEIDRVNIGTKEKPNWITPAQAVKDKYISQDSLNKLNRNITTAYREAQAAGDNSVKLPLPGNKDFVISGNQVADNLRNVTSLNYKFSPWYNRDKGNAETLKGEIYYKRRTLSNSDRGQQVTTLHEAMHISKETWDWGNDPDHQDVFKKAAEELLDL